MKENERGTKFILMILYTIIMNIFFKLFLTIFKNSLIIYSSHYNYDIVFVE